MTSGWIPPSPDGARRAPLVSGALPRARAPRVSAYSSAGASSQRGFGLLLLLLRRGGPRRSTARRPLALINSGPRPRMLSRLRPAVVAVPLCLRLAFRGATLRSSSLCSWSRLGATCSSSTPRGAGLSPVYGARRVPGSRTAVCVGIALVGLRGPWFPLSATRAGSLCDQILGVLTICRPSMFCRDTAGQILHAFRATLTRRLWSAASERNAGKGLQAGAELGAVSRLLASSALDPAEKGSAARHHFRRSVVPRAPRCPCGVAARLPALWATRQHAACNLAVRGPSARRLAYRRKPAPGCTCDCAV